MLIGIYLWIIGRIWLAGILAKRSQKTTHVAICSYHHRNVVLVAFGFWPSKHIAIFLTSSFRLMRVSIRFTGSRPRSGQEHKKKEHPKWNALKKDWRRPTFPQTSAVSSAMLGLTSLFGMGRGEHQLHSHQK